MPPVLRDPRADRLAALLADLGPGLRRGSALQPSSSSSPSLPSVGSGSELRADLQTHSSARPPSIPASRASGWSVIDDLIGGGFPADRLSEITGSASSGRTSIALGLLARTTRGCGELAAVVDLADAFDPASAEAAGVDLERVLWARVGDWREALRSTERLLETEGIPVVILDLGKPSPSSASLRSADLPIASLRSAGLSSASLRSADLSSASLRSADLRSIASRRSSSSTAARHAISLATAIPASAWIRLARLTTSSRTALVILSDRRLTGSQAEVVLEMRPPRPRFSGSPPLLEEIGLRAVLARRRGGHIADEGSDGGDGSDADGTAERLIQSG